MRRLGLAVLTLAALALIAAATPWAVVEFAAAGRIYGSADELKPARAGLVLGSARLVRNYVANPFYKNRIEAAAALYKSGKVEFLIVSGNQARGGRPRGGYDEPADMRDSLISAGVPASRIYRDYAGFRTLDSIVRAKEVFGQDRVIVVSQRFHLARALYLANRKGLDDDGFAAKDPPLRFGVRTKLREIAARVAALLDVAVGTEPRYLGTPIQLGVDNPT